MIIAAIDIGSNAARLSICSLYSSVHSNANKQIEYVRVPIRLGDAVFLDKKIPIHKMEDLLKLLKAFKYLMDLYRVDDYRACATSALREADNSKDVVELIHKETGVLVEVISGEEEAELIYRAHQDVFKLDERILFVDVGGGSTEISLLLGNEKILSKSFNIGTIRILDNKDDELIWEEMKFWLRTQVSPLKADYILGTGGNINRFFTIMDIKPNKTASLKQIKDGYNYLNNLSLKERILNLGLNPDRADVIVPAIDVYLNVMKYSGVTKIKSSKAGLKEGIIEFLYQKNKEHLSHEVVINEGFTVPNKRF